jgi:SAM-dependent methyltransferase
MMTYKGLELDLFADAAVWKRYFGGFFSPYLKGRVLEVGAGTGGTTRVLCDGSQKSWTCLEPDERLAEGIREKLRRGLLPACCGVVSGFVNDLSTSGRFDAVLYVDVLEHIDDDKGELARAAGLMGDGGHLLVLVPSCPWLYSPFDKAIGHVRRYTLPRLRAAMPASVRELRVLSLDSIGLFASLANKIALRQSLPSPTLVRFWDKIIVPLSKIADPCLGFRFGKSAVGIWRKG